MTTAILREAILPRMDGIRKNVERLKRLGELDQQEFFEEDNLALVQHYLRLSIERAHSAKNGYKPRQPGSGGERE